MFYWGNRTPMPQQASVYQTNVYTISRSKSFSDYWVFESREGLEPSSVSTYSVLRTGSLPFGHLDIFLFNKMSKNYIVGEEGLEPPVSKESGFTVRAATNYRLLSHFKEVDLRGTDCQNLYLGNPLLGTCAVLPVCCVPPYSFSRNQLLFTDWFLN